MKDVVVRHVLFVGPFAIRINQLIGLVLTGAQLMGRMIHLPPSHAFVLSPKSRTSQAFYSFGGFSEIQPIHLRKRQRSSQTPGGRTETTR